MVLLGDGRPTTSWQPSICAGLDPDNHIYKAYISDTLDAIEG